MKTFRLPLLIACISLLFAIATQAQRRTDRMYQEGQRDVWVGVGLLPTYLMDGAKMVLPPVTFGGDQMISDNFSLGGKFGYSVSEFKKDYATLEHPKTYQNTSYFFGIRPAAHCTKIQKWDIFGGFSLGYSITHIEVMEGGAFGSEEEHIKLLPKRQKLTYTGFLGIRYSCCGKVGVFGELGFGASLLMAGMTYRI